MPQCKVYRCTESYSGGLRFYPLNTEDSVDLDGYSFEYLGLFFFEEEFLSKLKYNEKYECWDEAVIE